MSRPLSALEKQRLAEAQAQKEQSRAERSPIIRILATPEGQQLIEHLQAKFRTEGDVFTPGCDPFQAAKQDGHRAVVNYLIRTSKELRNEPATPV